MREEQRSPRGCIARRMQTDVHHRLPGRAPIRRALYTAVLAAGLCVGLTAAPQESIERAVKAAYLFNFTKFVRWPAGVGASDQFRLCVVGDHRFAAALDDIIKGESADGRPLVRLEPTSIETARGCQILFVGSETPEHGRQLLGAVRDLPVLTVGEAPTFLEQGGTIRFVVADDRVRFDVSLPAASRAGVEISSKLLRVARRVDGGS